MHISIGRLILFPFQIVLRHFYPICFHLMFFSPIHLQPQTEYFVSLFSTVLPNIGSSFYIQQRNEFLNELFTCTKAGSCANLQFNISCTEIGVLIQAFIHHAHFFLVSPHNRFLQDHPTTVGTTSCFCLSLCSAQTFEIFPLFPAMETHTLLS